MAVSSIIRRSIMRSRVLLFLFAFACLPAVAPADPVTYTTAKLDIKTQQGLIHFTVEEALSEPQHEYGLMFRKHLADRHGMIFVFDKPRSVDFWMKNTLIPLDMLFVAPDGEIEQIARNAKPESTALISSKYNDVRAVIELPGGEAKKYSIAPGDKVVYPLFP